MKILKFGIFFVVFVFAVIVNASEQSGRTVSDIMTETRYLINGYMANGSEDTYWSDAELVSWINYAVRNVRVRAKNTMLESESFVLSSGTSEYVPTSNYLYVRAVMYQSATTAFMPLLPSTFEDRTAETGAEPKYFYELSGKVGVYPLKDDALNDVTVTGNTIYVLTVPRGIVLTSSDTLPTPALFDRSILFYTAAQALRKNGLFESADYFETLANKEIDRLRVDIYESKMSIWDTLYPKGQLQQTPSR